MPSLIRAFTAQSIPRFASGEFDARLYDAIVGQRALWSHIALQFIAIPSTVAELRIGRASSSAPVKVELRFYGEEDADVEGVLDEVAALLPAGFIWEERAASEATAIFPSDCYLARVRRRLEFVDLPAAAAAAYRAADAEIGDLIGLPGGGSDLRALPAWQTEVGELAVRRFCLPLPGPIDEHPTRLRSLFDEFQRTGSGIISICLSGLSTEDHDQSQRLALNWKRFLDPFAGELASAGLGSLETLRHSFDRFGLPREYLARLSTRIVAATPNAAIGLANVLAATIGGGRAFRVEPPTRPIPADEAADMLVSQEDDVPSTWESLDLEEAREELAGRLADERIDSTDLDGALLDFIIDLPNIHTLDEANRLLQLPIANEEGLAGVESRLVPPFTTPSVSFSPVRQPDGRMADPPPERVRIGMVEPNGATAVDDGQRYGNRAWHSLRMADLAKHALVVGSTGSGKTMTTLFLVRELDRLGLGFLIVEPVKTEYYDQLKERLPRLRRYRLEGKPGGRLPGDFLPFDPLRVPAHITVARHASYLRSCFQAAFPLDDLMALVLENALLEYYTSGSSLGCGFDKYARGSPERTLRIVARDDGGHDIFPSFTTFSRFLLDHYIEEAFAGANAQDAAAAARAHEWREIFRRRFTNLANSPVGDSFRAADEQLGRAHRDGKADLAYEPLARFLHGGQLIVELDAAPDADHKALMMALLMTYLFERRQGEDYCRRVAGRQKEGGTELSHVLILEEAHRLLSHPGAGRSGDAVGATAREKAIGLFVDMLAEIRAYGQGIVIVEQIPTKIIPEAVKNTSLKIMLRLTARDDREYLGTAMNFTEAQMHFVTGLKVEPGRQINMVCFEEALDQPLMLSLPLPDHSQAPREPRWLYDEFFESGGGRE